MTKGSNPTEVHRPGGRRDRRRCSENSSNNNPADDDATVLSAIGSIYQEKWAWAWDGRLQVQENLAEERVRNVTHAKRISSRSRFEHEKNKEQHRQQEEETKTVMTEETSESIGTSLEDESCLPGFTTPKPSMKRSISSIHDMGISPCPTSAIYPISEELFRNEDSTPTNVVDVSIMEEGNDEEEPEKEEPIVAVQTEQAVRKSFYTRIIGLVVYIIALAITLKIVLPVLKNNHSQDGTDKNVPSISTNDLKQQSTAATTSNILHNNNDDGGDDASTKTSPCSYKLQEDRNQSTIEMVSPAFQSRGIYQQHLQWRGSNLFDTRQQLLLQLLFESYTFQIQPSNTMETVATTCIITELDFQAITEANPTVNVGTSLLPASSSSQASDALVYQLSITYQISYESNVVNVYDFPVLFSEYLNDHQMILQTDMAELGFPVKGVSFVSVVNTEIIRSSSSAMQSSSLPPCNETAAKSPIPLSTVLSSGTTNYNVRSFCSMKLTNIVVVLVGFVLLR